MDFRRLDKEEARSLRQALRLNAEGGTILMDPKDTTFREARPAGDSVEDAEVIDAIRRVPKHY